MWCEGEIHPVTDTGRIGGEVMLNELRGQETNTVLSIPPIGGANGDSHEGSINDESRWLKRGSPRRR